MLKKKLFNKIYPKLIYLFLIFFLLNLGSAIAEVSEDKNNIKYESLEAEKKKKGINPFQIFKNKKKEKTKTPQQIIKKTIIIKKEDLKIGVLLPVSGKYSYIGQSLLDTMKMVIYDNKNQDVNLIVKDTKGKPQIAKKAVNDLVKQDVQIILGPFFSTSLQETTKIAKYNKIPLISFSNDYKKKDTGTYLMGFEPEKQIQNITEYTIKKNYKRFAALLPDNEYGKRVLYTYRNTLKKYQIPISKVELYNPKKKEFEKHVKKIVGVEESPKIEKDPETGENPLEDFDPGFDVLLIIESGGDLKHLSALLSYYGVDLPKVKLIGTGEWFEKGIGLEPGLNGAWFASPNPTLWQSFTKKFSKVYGYKPARLSSIAYDSLSVVLAIHQNKETQINYEDFQNLNGFTGIDGKFRFLSDGTVERNLAILEINNQSFKIKQQAKNKFF